MTTRPPPSPERQGQGQRLQAPTELHTHSGSRTGASALAFDKPIVPRGPGSSRLGREQKSSGWARFGGVEEGWKNKDSSWGGRALRRTKAREVDSTWTVLLDNPASSVHKTGPRGTVWPLEKSLLLKISRRIAYRPGGQSPSLQ